MRKRTFFLLAVLIVSKTLFSQDYKKVDDIVQNYPSSFSSPEKLAEKINADFILPEEKARAIFTWIALHVKYDVKALKSKPESISYSYSSQEEKLQKEREIMENLSKNTIKKRKAVCQGYSTLYKHLCDLVSLECEIIAGTSRNRQRDIGKIPNGSNHAWNAVKINDEWRLIDVTWGAGFVDENASRFIPEFKEYYFFLSPEKFSLEHYPEDNSWLLTEMPPEVFANLPLFHSTCFERDIEVIEPQGGIIELSRNEIFKLVLKNSENDLVSVQFRNQKNSQQIKPKVENGSLLYEIECEKSANTYLTVYVNTKAFMTFKIMKK